MNRKCELAYSLRYLRFCITYVDRLHLDKHGSRLLNERIQIMPSKEINLDGEKV